MYGDVVLGMKPTNKEDIDPFEKIIEEVKHAKGVKLDNELEVEDLKELVKKFKAAERTDRKGFPDLRIRATLGSYLRRIRFMDERTCYPLS